MITPDRHMKSISLSQSAYAKLKRHSQETGMPMGILVESWMDEWMAKAKAKEAARAAKAKASAPTDPPLAPTPAEFTTSSHPFLFVICTQPTSAVVMEPLGKNQSLVAVCARCRSEHPREGNYSFGGGQVAPGVGPGNHRSGSRTLQ